MRDFNKQERRILREALSAQLAGEHDYSASGQKMAERLIEELQDDAAPAAERGEK